MAVGERPFGVVRVVLDESPEGSMVALSTIQMGNAGFFNSLVLDSSGRLSTKNTGSIGSSTGSSNNTATVQGGAISVVKGWHDKETIKTDGLWQIDDIAERLPR